MAAVSTIHGIRKLLTMSDDFVMLLSHLVTFSHTACFLGVKNWAQAELPVMSICFGTCETIGVWKVHVITKEF